MIMVLKTAWHMSAISLKESEIYSSFHFTPRNKKINNFFLLFSWFYNNSCGHRTVYTHKENTHVRMQGDYILSFASNSDTILMFPSELRQKNSPHRLALSLSVFSLIQSSKRVGLWFDPYIDSTSAKKRRQQNLRLHIFKKKLSLKLYHIEISQTTLKEIISQTD